MIDKAWRDDLVIHDLYLSFFSEATSPLMFLDNFSSTLTSGLYVLLWLFELVRPCGGNDLSRLKVDRWQADACQIVMAAYYNCQRQSCVYLKMLYFLFDLFSLPFSFFPLYLKALAHLLFPAIKISLFHSHSDNSN